MEKWKIVFLDDRNNSILFLKVWKYLMSYLNIENKMINKLVAQNIKYQTSLMKYEIINKFDEIWNNKQVWWNMKY